MGPRWLGLIAAAMLLSGLPAIASADVLTWGSSGSGAGQFSSPMDVSVAPNGNVYVADPGNHRVQYFTENGSYLGQWGSYGTGPGQFDNDLHGVAVSPANEVYTLDVLPGSGPLPVQRFDLAGNFELGWGSRGSALGQFNYSYDIAISSSGYVYVDDKNNWRIQRFDANGGNRWRGAWLAAVPDSSTRPSESRLDRPAACTWLIKGTTVSRSSLRLAHSSEPAVSVNVRRDAHHRGINDLEGENGERRTCRRGARMELEGRLRLLPPASKRSEP
jgi:NHL repeat